MTEFKDPEIVRAQTWHMVFFFGLSVSIHAVLLLAMPFDGLYGQDSFAYFHFAGELRQAVAGLHLPGYFNWPLGYPALLALAFTLAPESPWVAQALSLLCAGLIPVLVYLGTLEFLQGENIPYGVVATTAFFAGLLVTCSGQIMLSGMTIMSDAPALMWATLSAYLLLRYQRQPKLLWLAGAAAALVLACLTRWLYILLWIPWLAFFFTANLRKIRVTHVAAAVALCAGLALPQLLHSTAFPKPLLQHQWLQDWHLTNAWQTAFDNADGHFEYAYPVFLFYAFPLAHPFYSFPLFLPFALYGAWRVVKRLTPRKALFLFIWIGSIYIFLIGIPYQSMRFAMPVYPPVAILTAFGLAAAWQTRKTSVAIFSTLGFAFMIFWGGRGFHRLVQQKQHDLKIVRWAQHICDGPALIFTFNLSQYFNHYTDDEIYDLFYNDPMHQGVPETPLPKYVLVDTENLNTQWRGRKPQQNFLWLQNEFTMRKEATKENYTLYSIAP